MCLALPLLLFLAPVVSLPLASHRRGVQNSCPQSLLPRLCSRVGPAAPLPIACGSQSGGLGLPPSREPSVWHSWCWQVAVEWLFKPLVTEQVGPSLAVMMCYTATTDHLQPKQASVDSSQGCRRAKGQKPPEIPARRQDLDHCSFSAARPKYRDPRALPGAASTIKQT